MFPLHASQMVYLVACPNHLKPSLAGGDEPLGTGGPFERFRLLLVVQRDEVRDRLEPPALLVRNLEVHSRPHRPASRLPRAVIARTIQDSSVQTGH